MVGWQADSRRARVWRDKAAGFMFRIDREISRKLRGRPRSVDGEVAALLQTYPTARAYGLSESADPRTVPERRNAS